MDVDFHKLGDSFAVENHAFRQIGHHILQRLAERRAFGSARLDFIVSRRAVRKDENRVVRACVTVNRDAVERIADGIRKTLLQSCLLDDGIRRQIAEHRGLRWLHLQFRGNHARAFRHAADANGCTADVQ